MKNNRSLKIGAYSVGLTAIVIAVIIALNLLIGQLPATFTKLDASPEKIISVGADTKKILKTVKTDITIYHIFSEGKADTSISGILERYEDSSSKIKVKTIDPLKDPSFVKKYTTATLTENSLIVVSEKRSTVVNGSDMYKYEIEGYEGQYISYEEYYSYSQQMQYYGQSVSATEYFFAENEITKAIDYVAHDDLPIMYALAGHGETDISSGAYGQLISDENVELKALELLKGESVSVPTDASALVINGPTADITEAESKAIISYLNGGGTVILMSFIDYYSAKTMPNLAAVCSHMGLAAVEELIVETNTNNYYQYPYYLIPNTTGYGITQAYAGSNLYLFMIASHAIKETGSAENISTAPLLETSDGAYIYTEEAAQEPEKAEKSKFSVAYQSIISDEEGNKKGTLYWFATPYFLSDDFSTYGNGELFTAILTATCEKPTSVSVIGKPLTQTYLQITETTSFIWTVVLVGIIPLTALVAGLIVWVSRRRR